MELDDIKNKFEITNATHNRVVEEKDMMGKELDRLLEKYDRWVIRKILGSWELRVAWTMYYGRAILIFKKALSKSPNLPNSVSQCKRSEFISIFIHIQNYHISSIMQYYYLSSYLILVTNLFMMKTAKIQHMIWKRT